MNIHEISLELGQLISKLEETVVQVKTDRRTATAFVIEDGFLVTAAHTLRKGGPVRILSASGEETPIKIVGRDFRFNLALLETGSQKSVPETADGENLRVGHLVFPLGRPGKSLRAAFGMVSALGASRHLHGGGVLSRYIETDGSLPSGFSGGPLMDSQGRLLGMNSSIPRGAGMTVPMKDIHMAVTRIREIGDVRRAYLGINTVSVPMGENDDSSGLMITEIEAGSPAEKAALLQGDILYAVAGSPVGDVMELVAVLGSGIADKEVLVKVLRSGEELEILITPTGMQT